MPKPANPYSVHPGVEMVRKWVAELKGRSGRTLEEWVALLEKKGPKGEKERRAWLAKEHGFKGMAAWWVAERSVGKGTWSEDPEAYLAEAVGYVEEMYSGKKAALRPIYDALLAKGLALGKDVKACPCQTMVPLYRKFVFAEIRPATNGRVDLALALGDQEPEGRLERVSAAAGNRIGHRIALASPDEVDAEVDRWLRAAYAKGNETAAKPKPAGKAPKDLEAVLKKSAKARATFDALTPRMRGDWIAWIEEAKKPETRAKRVARAAERLAAGKKAIY